MRPDKLLTAYCLGFGSWTVIPHYWHECFAEMRDLGFNAVALSFSESEMRYARRTFEMQVDTAHRLSLQVHVIPSRLGGRLAGAPLMGSLWLNRHPRACLPELGGVACVESPEFRQWSTEFIETLVRDYEVDGIIWDEPKDVDFITAHPDAVAKLGQGYGAEACCRSFVELIGEWTTAALNIRPGLVMSIFNMPAANPVFTRLCAGIKGIDYAGYDGSLCDQSYFHELPVRLKTPLLESWPRTVSECDPFDCGTFALVENMLMPASEHAVFVRNLEIYLERAVPDHLACYYYAHNNESPQEAHRLTMDLIAKHYLKANRRSA